MNVIIITYKLSWHTSQKYLSMPLYTSAAPSTGPTSGSSSLREFSFAPYQNIVRQTIVCRSLAVDQIDVVDVLKGSSADNIVDVDDQQQQSGDTESRP